MKKQTKNEINQIKLETQQAIDRGMDAAHAEWRRVASLHLLEIAKTNKEFTMNDVRDLIRQEKVQTHDNRAMGGVVITARKLGWIEPSGRSILSRVGHKSVLQVWKSLIYKK